MAKFAFLSVQIGLVCAAAFLAACGDDVGNPEVVVQPQQDAAMEAQEAAPAEAAADVIATGVCSHVLDKHVAVVFTAPDPRPDGVIKIAAMVNFPPVVPYDIGWADPFCSAALPSEETLTCDFGAAYESTVVEFIAGIGKSEPDAGISGQPFSWVETVTEGDKQTFVHHVSGTYVVCIGPERVGGYEDGKFDKDGVLGYSKVEDNANLRIDVP